MSTEVSPFSGEVELDPTMASQELAKFEALLQKPDAIKRFRSLFERCRHLTRARNMPVTDGELMTVCAYLTGREYAGSAATKDACARLGCITSKTFDRVKEGVSNLIQKSVMAQAPKAPTIHSMGQKYGFNPEELLATQAAEAYLTYKITNDLQDERIVCAAFSVICQYFGYKSNEWIQREVECYELDQEEVETLIERMRVIHSEQLIAVMETSRNPGRSSRHSRIKPQTLTKANGLVPPPLKRKASEEAVQNQGPIKRAKLHSKSTASASSTPRSASSDATRQSPPTTVLSALDWMSTLGASEKDEYRTVSNRSQGDLTGAESPNSMESESENEDVEDLMELDWENLSRRRANAIAQRRKQISSGIPIPKPVFADRNFWQTTSS